MGAAPSKPPISKVHGPEGEWKIEDYSFRVDIYQKLLEELQCGAPSLDAFANAENFKSAFFWSKEVDAFSQDWAGQGFFRCNPPFTMMDEVVRKIHTEGALD